MAHFEFSYTLAREEALEGLKRSGIYKTSGKRAVVETAVLVVFFLFFLISYFVQREFFNLAMAIVTLGVLAGLVLVPAIDMRKQAKMGQKQIRLRLYEDRLYIDTPGEETRCVPLNGSTKVKTVGKKQEIVALLLEGGGLLLIPVRAVPKEMRGRVLSLLLQQEDG